MMVNGTLKPIKILALMLTGFLLTLDSAPAQTNAPDAETLRGWVQAMKKSPRGPFKQIRWFCNDGTVQLPQEYACKDHGGGVQHGEWTERVRILRDSGYYLANIFADVRARQFLQDQQYETVLKQMLLEQFLIEADDGWIFRRARYYRGALQDEDEAHAGRELLLALISDANGYQNRFILLREAVRFIPHGYRGAPITEMRQLSRNLAETDANFETLRIKLHVKPEAADAQRVRDYAASQGKPELAADYEHLAEIIENVFRSRDLPSEIHAFASRIKVPQLAADLRHYAGKLSDQNDAPVRFLAASHLLAALRDDLAGAADAGQILAAFEISLLLENELFRIGNIMVEQMAPASRHERLTWLSTYADGLYGVGLISRRQRLSLQQNLSRLMQASPPLGEYKSELDYCARIPEWADRALRFYFGEAVEHFAEIEPLSRRYIHDRLRGSLLLSYTAVLESLMVDANRQLGIRNFVFGQPVDSGLRGLNAGLARGTLRVSGSEKMSQQFDPAGIYVLPATTEDLPRVAGIITTGEGNILSHVQLLARNLGIPNVAVDGKWFAHIQAMAGQKVVLAVSPRGNVQLTADGPQWNEIFKQQNIPDNMLIRPDMKKLDLKTRNLIALENLRAGDSGKVCGPKAANLGELKHFFPEAVTEGLVIPFGVFRELLDRPIEPGGPRVFHWMQDQYKIMQRLQGDVARREQVLRKFLEQIQQWIINAEPGAEFRERLRAAMEQTFGPDGTYGVFVRSDTNVEDLPGFSGAGLNLTVPNVVGFRQVMAAIARVWASPFSERAFRWRQAYMESPEHVYVSVLLLKSVPVEKSGVLVTADVDTGRPEWLTIAVSEGVGGAVAGQTAEELRINTGSGDVRLMAHATEPYKRVLLPEGGVGKVAASGTEAVLDASEIKILTQFAKTLHERFPALRGSREGPIPADVEFGFYQKHLVLFQIRPFLESKRAQQNMFLNELDSRLSQNRSRIVNLNEIPSAEDQ